MASMLFTIIDLMNIVLYIYYHKNCVCVCVWREWGRAFSLQTLNMSLWVLRCILSLWWMRFQFHQHATRRLCDKPLGLNIIVKYESLWNVATPCFFIQSRVCHSKSTCDIYIFHPTFKWLIHHHPNPTP